MHIYHSRWHEISQEHIENLFNKYLRGVTALPFPLLPELAKLEKATLEVVEDRKESTVYLVRETGGIYHVMERGVMYGPLSGWASDDRDKDVVKQSYKSKPCVFVIAEIQNSNYLYRLKSPKFLAQYDPKTKEILNLQWLDPEPSQITAISTLKKAKIFLQERVK